MIGARPYRQIVDCMSLRRRPVQQKRNYIMAIKRSSQEGYFTNIQTYSLKSAILRFPTIFRKLDTN